MLLLMYVRKLPVNEILINLGRYWTEIVLQKRLFIFVENLKRLTDG